MENLIRFWMVSGAILIVAAFVMLAFGDIVNKITAKIIRKVKFNLWIMKMMKRGRLIKIGKGYYEVIENTHIEEV